MNKIYQIRTCPKCGGTVNSIVQYAETDEKDIIDIEFHCENEYRNCGAYWAERYALTLIYKY